MRAKLALTHAPTPLWQNRALNELIGAEVWVKRDDISSGAAAGNKIRKLEYLLADAQAARATVLITCGGVQSNHARATALLGAELGMRSILLLRSDDPNAKAPLVGNLFVDRLVGAEVRFISHADYQDRAPLMKELSNELTARGERAYVIPEGGSNGLGSLGYVDAMREVRTQLDLGLGGGPREFDAIVHACGSGGTAAGVALGAARYEIAPETHAMAICDSRSHFQELIARIVAESQAIDPRLSRTNQLSIHDEWKGPAYSVTTKEQREFIVDVARRTGLVLDPVYTGKALFGLSRLEPKPKRVLFIHTGGLPGLLAQADAFEDAVS